MVARGGSAYPLMQQRCMYATNAYKRFFSAFLFRLSIPIFFCSSFHFLGMKQIMSSNAVHVQVMNNCERTNVADDEGETNETFIGILSSLKALSCETVWEPGHVCVCYNSGAVSAYEHVWIGGNENTLSSVTCDSFKSFKLRLFSNNELASFTIVFESCCFFYKYKRFRLFHFLEQKKNKMESVPIRAFLANLSFYHASSFNRFVFSFSAFFPGSYFFLVISTDVCSFLLFTLYRLNVICFCLIGKKYLNKSRGSVRSQQINMNFLPLVSLSSSSSFCHKLLRKSKLGILKLNQ